MKQFKGLREALGDDIHTYSSRRLATIAGNAGHPLHSAARAELARRNLRTEMHDDDCPHCEMKDGEHEKDCPHMQEKTLTPAEKKKREEVAKAIERDNPNMPMDKKMAIATATAKKVAEDISEKVYYAIATRSAKAKSGWRRVPDTKFDTKQSAERYGDKYHTDKYGSKMYKIVTFNEETEIAEGYVDYSQQGKDSAKELHKQHNGNVTNKHIEDHINDLHSSMDDSHKLDKQELHNQIKKHLGAMKEGTYKVDVEGLPSMFVDAGGPTEVKQNLRKILKKADMIKAVDRVQPSEVKKHFRLKAQGKEETQMDESRALNLSRRNAGPMKAAFSKYSDDEMKKALKIIGPTKNGQQGIAAIKRAFKVNDKEAEDMLDAAIKYSLGEGVKAEAVTGLHPDTLRSYMTKASDARKHRDLPTKKVDNRYAGVHKADKKLTQLDKIKSMINRNK